jgi:hypothetical protein
MAVIVLFMIGMFVIIWFKADRSGRRDVLFPSFSGSYPMSGQSNPYMGKMCLVGLMLAVPISLVAGLLVWLSTITS